MQADGAGIVVSNKGLGPATLKTLRYWADGRELTGRDGVADRAGLLDIPDTRVVFGVNIVNTPLAPNEDLRLVWVPLPTDAGKVRTSALIGAWSGLKEITWDYCYCSVYGECWHSQTGDLDVKPVKECSIFRSAFRPAAPN